MFFFPCSWFSRNAVRWARSFRSLRRTRLRPSAAPLQVECLEDRLTPAASVLFPPVIVVDPGPSQVPPNLPALQPNTIVIGTIQHLPQTDQYTLALPASGQLTILAVGDSSGANIPRISLQESDGDQLVASTNGTATVFLLQPSGAETYLLSIKGGAAGPYQVSVQFTPLTPSDGSDGSDSGGGPTSDPDNGSGAASGPGNHHFLSALASAGADGPDFPNLGDGMLRSFLGGIGGNPPALAIALEQRLVAMTTTMVVQSDPVNRSSSFSAGALASASPGESAGLLNRFALPGELPGFSAFSPTVLMTSGKNHALAFELSPYSPTGPDIVPIPVPRGLEDWLAEFLGGSSQEPGPEGHLGASNDANGTSLRDAVFQMLQEGWAPPAPTGTVPANVFPSTAVPPLPPLPENIPPGASGASIRTSSLPNVAAKDALLAAAPPDEETDGPVIESSAGSMLAAFAVGLGSVGWRERRRDEDASRRGR